jgi:hypothetical protein
LSQQYQSHFDKAYVTIAQKQNLRRLESLFTSADEDRSGQLDLAEFMQALNNPQIREGFSRLGIQPHQSELVFRTLDAKNEGSLSITAFLEGLAKLIGCLDFGSQAAELDILDLKPGRGKRRSRQQGAEQEKQDPTLLPTGGAASQQIQRAFVNSALAQALHPAIARKK